MHCEFAGGSKDSMVLKINLSMEAHGISDKDSLCGTKGKQNLIIRHANNLKVQKNYQCFSDLSKD